MGLRIEQFDVQSVAKVFVTRIELENNVREKLNMVLESSLIESEGIEIEDLSMEDGLKRNKFNLRPASKTTIGGIKLGKNLVMNDDYTVDAKGEEYIAGEGIILDKTSEPFVIKAKKATSTELGAIKLGQNLTYNDITGCVDSRFDTYEGGRGIEVKPHTGDGVKLIESKIASGTEYGVVKLGKGLSYDNESGKVNVKSSDIIDPSNDLVASDGKIKIPIYSNGEGILLNNSNEKNRVFSLAPATNNTLGGIKVGEGLSVEQSGIVSVVDKKATTSTLGSVIVGQNLSITSGGVLSSDVSKDEIKKLEREIETLKLENILLFSEIERIYEIIGSTNIGTSMHKYADNFITGSSLVDISLGTDIKFPKTLSNTNYKVNITLSDKTDGSVGELWVENKTVEGFTIKGSGMILKTRVDWVAFLDEESTEEFNKTTFPYIKGNINLNSTTPVTVNFPSPMSNTNYAVIVSPLGDPEGYYGEVFVDSKTINGFNIQSSGRFTGTVEYIVAEYGKSAYDKTNHPVIGGYGTFNSLEPVRISIDENLTTNSYQVLLMPEGNHSGTLGEIWVSEKERDGFTVNTTGGTVNKFNYILIGN